MAAKEAAKAAKAAAAEAKAAEPKPPKKPSNQYACFVAASQQGLKAENPDLPQPELMRMLGERWKNMGEEERAPYVEAAAVDDVRYRDAYATYKEACEAAGLEPVKEAPVKKDKEAEALEKEERDLEKAERKAERQERRGKKRAAESAEPKEPPPPTVYDPMGVNSKGTFENALPSSEIDVDNLEGAMVLVKWPEYGWLRGVVTDKNDDEEEKDDRGREVNWFVEYADDETEAGHFLSLDDYKPKEKAKNWCWCVIRPPPPEEPAPEAEELAAEPAAEPAAEAEA